MSDLREKLAKFFHHYYIDIVKPIEGVSYEIRVWEDLSKEAKAEFGEDADKILELIEKHNSESFTLSMVRGKWDE